MHIIEKIYEAHKALDNNEIEKATLLLDEVESELPQVTLAKDSYYISANLGGALIDLGSWTHNQALIERGVKHTEKAISLMPEGDSPANLYYNVANGYLALWELSSKGALKNGQINESYLMAKNAFRKALALAAEQPGSVDRNLHAQILVNYGNCLDSMGRSIDAISQYDQALKFDNLMGQALGNKGVTLHHSAFLVHGYTHSFLLEAYRLLDEALKQPLHEQAVSAFRRHYDQIALIRQQHKDEMKPENTGTPKTISPFHEFLRQFCVRHQLYLTPTTFIGPSSTTVYGDPMFISRIIAPVTDSEKFDRYITFLNEIKADYVLARYMLVQSQYQNSALEAIDLDVDLYYPLDYSVYSSYIQMLKTSLRLAIDVLDKISFFVRDYCGVTSLKENQVNFRNIWATQSLPLTLRPELASKENIFLFALFDLSLEIAKDGVHRSILEYRQALTHRFLVVHDMLLSRQTNTDIPRVLLDDLLRDSISAMQLARSAIIYLILFVEVEEHKLEQPDIVGGLPGTLIDDGLRWVPLRGDVEN